MPCFLAGESQARTLGAAPNFRYIHFRIRKVMLQRRFTAPGRSDWYDRPFLAFHAPGGTSEGLLVRPDETSNGYSKNYRISGLESRTSGVE